MMTQTQVKLTFKSILYKLFNKPSIVLIGGTWKTGKTDMGLMISERLLKSPYWVYKNEVGLNGEPKAFTLVNEVASNIDTFGTYPLITDLQSLKQWLYGSPKRKLYIFDEASEHLPNTRGMSAKSVGIKSIIPQVSKAHGRMIIIGHNLIKLDSEMLDDTWCRGIFFKYNLKNATILSNLLPKPFDITDIRPTNIKFDPYILAPFTERSLTGTFFKEEDKQLLWRWSNGESNKSLGLHPMQLNRKVRSFVKRALENEQHISQS